MDSLLQAPFTGSYTAQSGEVLGILKSMRDTFESNLEAAIKTEETAVKTFDKFMKTKTEEFDAMSEEYEKKQGILGDNDADLAEKKEAFETNTDQVEEDKEFLSKLFPMCDDKEEAFEKRKILQANEAAAVAKAISLLNSEKLEGSEATKFLQLGQIKRHVSAEVSPRKKIVELLARGTKKSEKIRRVVALLQAGNPFTKVLAEIENMQTVLDEEGKLDKEQLDYCNSERETNDDSLDKKKSDIEDTEAGITKLENNINDPATGLLKGIGDTSDDLDDNLKKIKDETAARRDENMQYTKAINDLVEARDTIVKATAVLKKYYQSLEKVNDADDLLMVQKGKDDPAPPEALKGDFKGQSSKGNEVIEMLEEIIDSVTKEEATMHETEIKAATAYENSMADLKEEEASLQKAKAKHRSSMADTKQDLQSKRGELDKTTKEKVSIERYLESIKPGCDFITDNFDKREENRATEKDALKKAAGLLKDSPVFKSDVAAEDEAALGDCKDRCEDKEQAKCKACLAGVSVPGYCAGHKGAPGC